MLLIPTALLGLAILAEANALYTPINKLINTTSGPVRGFSPTLGVRAYLGIPYATPPIGELRFLPAQPAKRNDEPIDATRFGKSCMQFSYKTPYSVAFPSAPFAQSEDCLSLNIWVPERIQKSKAGKLPSMVFIYGGGFSEGSTADPSEYIPPVLRMYSAGIEYMPPV